MGRPHDLSCAELKRAQELPAITDDDVRAFIRESDARLLAVGCGGHSMRELVQSVSDGACWSCFALDSLPVRAYDDLQEALVRGGWELRGDYVVGMSVMVVRRAPTEIRP